MHNTSCSRKVGTLTSCWCSHPPWMHGIADRTLGPDCRAAATFLLLRTPGFTRDAPAHRLQFVASWVPRAAGHAGLPFLRVRLTRTQSVVLCIMHCGPCGRHRRDSRFGVQRPQGDAGAAARRDGSELPMKAGGRHRLCLKETRPVVQAHCRPNQARPLRAPCAPLAQCRRSASRLALIAGSAESAGRAGNRLRR